MNSSQAIVIASPSLRAPGSPWTAHLTLDQSPQGKPLAQLVLIASLAPGGLVLSHRSRQVR